MRIGTLGTPAGAVTKQLCHMVTILHSADVSAECLAVRRPNKTALQEIGILAVGYITAEKLLGADLGTSALIQHAGKLLQQMGALQIWEWRQTRTLCSSDSIVCGRAT